MEIAQPDYYHAPKEHKKILKNKQIANIVALRKDEWLAKAEQ